MMTKLNILRPTHFMSPGIRSWDVDLKSCNLNLYLQEFLSHHMVSFKGAGESSCLSRLYPNSMTLYHVESPVPMVTSQFERSGVNS